MAKKVDKKKAAKKGATKSASDTKSIRLSEHPVARTQIRQAKSWAGLGGFALASYAAWHGGAPFADTVLRGLLWGVIAYFVMWFCAVQVWRHLAVAEVRAAVRQVREERERLAAAKREAEAAAAGD